jgi:hypothetical protein
MNKLFTIIILNIITLTSVFGQTKRNYFPVGTYHQENANIHGVSVGLWTWRDEPKNVTSNGIKVELIGIGILVALIPRSPIVDDRADFDTLMKAPVSERINGMSVSTTGTACDCKVNGLSLGGYGQINRQINGISITSMFNFTQVLNGLQFSLVMNETYKMNGVQLGGILSNSAHEMNGVQLGVINTAEDANGVQIGLFNKSERLNGIQIGLWNVNEERKLPFINWHSKKRHPSVKKPFLGKNYEKI